MKINKKVDAHSHTIPRTTYHSHYCTEPTQAEAVEYRIAIKTRSTGVSSLGANLEA